MRFVANDPRGVWITWYWCPPGAVPGPYTVFASGNWSSDPIWPWIGPGEVKGAPRPWYNGANPWGFKGDHFHGDEKAWAEGLDEWPDPSEWTWGCCSWPSWVRICLGRKPAQEEPVIGPSYAEEFGPLQLERPWNSAVCICVVPSSRVAFPARPIRGYYSQPTPTAALASHLCVCVLPSSRVGPLPTRSSGYASITGTISQLASRACVCVLPSSRVGPLPTRSSGYASMSHQIAAVSSAVCVCLTPSSRIGTLPPAGSGYASITGPIAALTSHVCVCIDPSAEVSLPQGAYSSSRPAFLFCGCLVTVPLFANVVGTGACAVLSGRFPLTPVANVPTPFGGPGYVFEGRAGNSYYWIVLECTPAAVTILFSVGPAPGFDDPNNDNPFEPATSSSCTPPIWQFNSPLSFPGLGTGSATATVSA